MSNYFILQDMGVGNFSVLDVVKKQGLKSNHPVLDAFDTVAGGVGSVCISSSGKVMMGRVAVGDGDSAAAQTTDLSRSLESVQSARKLCS